MKRFIFAVLFVLSFASTVFATLPNEDVFNWVQYKFADMFPKSQTVKSELTINGVHYDLRSWAGDWGTRYLGITDDGEIIGLGDFTDGELLSFGYIDDWEEAVVADNNNVYGFDINKELQDATLSDAGTWVTKPDNENYGGDLAVIGKSLMKLNNDDNYSLVVTGWSYQGFGTDLEVPPTVNMAIFTPELDGTLHINTDTYIDDPVTNGGANVIIEDFNNDSQSDILLPAHNETPFVGRESTAYLSNSSGSFDKIQWGDSLVAHGATLVHLDGEPVVYTSTFIDGLRHPIITYENGQFETKELTNRPYTGGMTAEVLFDRIDNTHVLVEGEYCSNYNETLGAYEDCNFGFFNMDGYDAASTQPIQEVAPYLNTVQEYVDYGINVGRNGNTHVFKIFGDDVNNDGRDDLVALNFMWTQERNDYPCKVDIVMASGNGFYNATEQLNPDIPINADIGDHSPIVFDIDNSGINTYFFSTHDWRQDAQSFDEFTRYGTYVLLNDGTGRLHIGLHDEFYSMANYLTEQGFAGFYNYDYIPDFFAIPQHDGSVNFLAVSRDYNFVNIPIHWNPTIHFNEDITISDRNNSKLMRTWAGDDVIYDTNANGATHIDGGFGVNKCVYSGNEADYSIVNNADGSVNVISLQHSIDDTLVNIQTVEFSDGTVEL